MYFLRSFRNGAQGILERLNRRSGCSVAMSCFEDSNMSGQAELAFIKTFAQTLAALPVTYPDDYAQPPANALKRIPLIPVSPTQYPCTHPHPPQIDIPPPPKRIAAPAASSSGASRDRCAAPTHPPQRPSRSRSSRSSRPRASPSASRPRTRSAPSRPSSPPPPPAPRPPTSSVCSSRARPSPTPSSCKSTPSTTATPSPSS